MPAAPPAPRRPAEVAIVGRPNVGKSTLFNRLVGRRLALVDDTPGVTRDRREGDAALGDLRFRAVDTAGLDEVEAESLAGRMRAQTERAVAAADVSLFVVDARTGLTPLDRHFAALLRKGGKPVILVANKAEGRRGEDGFYDAFGLGFGEPVPISAEHGEGMADLRDALAPFVAEEETDGEAAEPDAERRTGPLTVAVVGRPNAGKSTLINRLIGEDRLVTGPEAGITRDSIAIDWTWHGRAFRLNDTAGLRRKSRIEGKLEKLSVGDTLRAMKFAEVVVLVLDSTTPFDKQDLQIADLVEREGRAIVIAADKWDLVADRQAHLTAMREAADRLLPQIRGVPVVAVSGQTGEGLDLLMETIVAAADAWNRRVSTAGLNRWLAKVVEDHPPPAVSGRRIRLRYMTQPKARPPTFVAFCSRPEALPDDYRRYLVNGLRDTFGLPGVPIRLHLRKGDNPYEGKKRSA